MKQEKIGKLIAKLRKEKGLTQQELGDKVGVGYRAVSKWETGLTLPDISIIKELSEILGITADELLKGELNKPTNNHKTSKKNYLFLIPIIIISLIIITLFLKEYNREYKYELDTNNGQSHISGRAILKGNKLSLNINKISFDDYAINQIMIKNYQYNVLSNDSVIIGFGYNDSLEIFQDEMSIGELMENLTINYVDEINIPKDVIVKNNLKLVFTFIDINDNPINKEIEIILIPEKEANQLDK